MLTLALTLGAVAGIVACGQSAHGGTRYTLETLPYAALPDGAQGLRLPESLNAVAALLAELPATVAGRARLPDGAAQLGVAEVAYGETNGTTGQLPLRLDIVDTRLAPAPYAAPNAEDAVLRELNAASTPRGDRWSGGRDGPLIWFEQTSGGYRLIWGQLGSPWLFVISAPTGDQLAAMLDALRQTLGTRGGGGGGRV